MESALSKSTANGAAAPTAAASSADDSGLWLTGNSHAPADEGKPEFMLRLPPGTTHVQLELKMITTDELGQLHETNAVFDGAPSAAWIRHESQAAGDPVASALGAGDNRAEPAQPQPKKQKRSHSKKKADKAIAAAPSSATRDKLRVRGDPPVKQSQSKSAAPPGQKSASSTKGRKTGRGKLVAIVSKEDHNGSKRWRCQWENGSESWESATDLNHPEDENTQRIFISYEAKLGAALKKAARSKNEEEKDSDESEEVPELGEDEAFPEKILADRVEKGVVEYQVLWWCPPDARTDTPETSWEPAENLEGAQELLQDYFRQRSRKEKEKIEAGRKAARVNSGQSDDEMSDDGLQQYEGQF